MDVFMPAILAVAQTRARDHVPLFEWAHRTATIDQLIRADDPLGAIRLAETLCPPLIPEVTTRSASPRGKQVLLGSQAEREAEQFDVGWTYLLLSELWARAEQKQWVEGTLESVFTLSFTELMEQDASPAKEHSLAYKRAAHRVLSALDGLEASPQLVAILVLSYSTQSRAEERLETAWKKAPGNSSLRYVRAHFQASKSLLGGLKELSEAAVALESLVSEGIADQRMLELLSVIYEVYQGKPRSSGAVFVPRYSKVELAQVALDRWGPSVWAYNGLATESVDRNMAMDTAQRALALNPGSVSAHWVAVELQLKYGNVTEAYEAALKALDAFPRSPLLIEQLAKCLVRMGRRSQVESLIDDAVQAGRTRLAEVLLGYM